LIHTDIREYQPGDDVKHIHWKATARTGTVFVKSYEEDRQLRIVLAVDASASMRAPASQQAFSKVIEFSALVGALAQRGNDMIGLSLFAETELTFLPPRAAAKRCNQILQALHREHPPATSTDLQGALKRLTTGLRKPSIIFVLSDLFAPPFEDDLKALGVRHDVVLTHIQPNVTSLPRLGLVSFVDAESGEQVVIDSSSKRVREAWSRALDEQRDQARSMAKRCSVDYIVLRESASQPLVELMRARAMRARS
jgi:uncharacterized protein (DUF58 family)